jgi:hypothetical protein
MSIQPETLAWLRQTAKFEGGVTAQVLLHLLEQVEALEAKDQLDVEAWASMRRASCDYQRRLSNLEAAQQPHHDKLDRLIEQDRKADDEAAPVATDEELWSLWANRPNLPNSPAAALRAIYDLGRQHGAAQAAPAAESAADNVIIHCPETCWVQIRRITDGKVIYSNYRRGRLVLQVDEPPAAPAAPAGGLVEKVESVIRPTIPGDPNVYRYESRAAIREVAAWLDQRGMHGCALWLREEVDR